MLRCGNTFNDVGDRRPFFARGLPKGRNLGARIVPIKIALYPHIGEPDDEDRQEHSHLDKSKEPQLTIDQGPGEQKNDRQDTRIREKACLSDQL